MLKQHAGFYMCYLNPQRNLMLRNVDFIAQELKYRKVK